MAENKQKFEKPAGGSGHMRGGFGKPKDLKATALRTFSYLTKRPLMLVAALISVILSSLSGVAGTYAMRPIINGLTDAVKSGSNVFPELGKGILLMSLVLSLIHI